jgi:hypothetical protein
MKYLINSNARFAPLSLKKLIPSLIDCGISPKEIFVIIGGSDRDSESFIDNGQFNCLYTKIDAIDQTSFCILDNNENLFEDDYYFYLHDTCFAGTDFKKNTDALIAKIGSFDAIKCFCGKSCNIGIYNKISLLKFLRSDSEYAGYKDVLCDISNPNNYDKLMKKKSISFNMEDKFFNHSSKYMSRERVIVGKEDVYNTGNKRVVFHFKGIDLYKTTANTMLYNEFTTFLGCKL